ncbi:MAG: DUF1553 domain-containing protein, partial [Planctomycetota bacterium]
ERFPPDVEAIGFKADRDRTPREKLLGYLVERQVHAEYDRIDRYIKGESKERRLELLRQLRSIETQPPQALPIAMTVTDVGLQSPPTIIPKRNHEVQPGAISLLDPEPMEIDPPRSGQSTGRRATLAKWLTRADNPLTPRVITNRIWQFYFGRGLAANPSDFGRLGGAPSHPELLDWLAAKLIDDGWQLKSLHRRILLSATYRQSTSHPDFARQQSIDAANASYWRGSTRRMRAEQIRDSLLSISGRLTRVGNDARRGGPSRHIDGDCRTIYTRVKRNSPDELLAQFDLPQFFNSNAERSTTTTPLQALMMFNSDRVISHAHALAQSVGGFEIKDDADLQATIAKTWKRVFSRDIRDDELLASWDYLTAQTKLIRQEQRDTSLESIPIEMAKLPYRDGQAIKMSLDESSMRLSVPHETELNVDDFTIEAFFEIRSIAQSGAVRTLVGKWDPAADRVGWKFGVTGKGSRRKPQTLVLHAVGDLMNGKTGEAAIFSDQHIELNVPYYAAASVQLAKPGQPGEVTFYLKDLSNDDEPLHIASIPHQLTGGFENPSPFTFGRISGTRAAPFDGLIDDVRLTSVALPQDQILYTIESENDATVGYWQFESDPGVRVNSVRANSSDHTLSIDAHGEATVPWSASQAAFVDWCHVLLNSNEFLYID